MFLIIVISFVYLGVKFCGLAVEFDWCLEKIIASVFFVFAITALFACVVVDSIVFRLLPFAFTLVAIDLLSAPVSSKRA